MTFQELNLSQPLLRAVAQAGYQTPSPIQAGAIPPVLAGRDLLGCAQTGTGKTAAFALPMLDRLAAIPPRKTFSMGHAEEKRYYIECRRIAEQGSPC